MSYLTAAVLAAPWTLIGAYLYAFPTPHGTSLWLRLSVYLWAAALTCYALGGILGG